MLSMYLTNYSLRGEYALGNGGIVWKCVQFHAQAALPLATIG
jgi:hypothetical protein